MSSIGMSGEQAAAFSTAAGKAPHDLVGNPLFDDDALAALLDAVPRSNLQVFTMGTDPVRTDEWRKGSVGDLSGAQLLAAARRGRLWFNVIRVHEVDQRFGTLLDELFADLQAKVPGLVVEQRRATLLISSPGAQVYYHADAQPNLLWHVRGTKRVWVYPALDERYMTEEALGRIFTGEADEQLPYDGAWDAEAQVIDLAAGEVAWWPQNSPHRVMNVDGFNVSLSTEFTTAASTQRVNVRAANHVLRSRLHVPSARTAEQGLLASAKVAGYRLGRRAGVLKTPAFERPVAFVVSPDDERGWTETPVRAQV